MKINTTDRGFGYVEFQDNRRQDCSVQKSSNAEKDCIWLGCNDINLQMFDAIRCKWPSR